MSPKAHTGPGAMLLWGITLAAGGLAAFALAFTTCSEPDPRGTPEACIESAVAYLKDRRVQECADQFLTEDFHWGNRDRDRSIDQIERYLALVDRFLVTTQGLETTTTGLDAEFELTVLVGLTLNEKSEFEGLPIEGLRLEVEGKQRWTEDGWRISSFTVRNR